MLVFYLPVTASHHRKKFKFLPHLSHPAVTESSVSVQVARMLFYSVFLLFALIYFPSLVISKAEVSDWARCPQYVLWAFWVLSALLSGCLVCHYQPIFGSGTQIINCLTPRSDPSSLSYYFTKIPAFLGGIKPPTSQLTAKRAIAPQRAYTVDMHLLTNFTFPHNKKKHIVVDK